LSEYALISIDKTTYKWLSERDYYAYFIDVLLKIYLIEPHDLELIFKMSSVAIYLLYK